MGDAEDNEDEDVLASQVPRVIVLRKQPAHLSPPTWRGHLAWKRARLPKQLSVIH